jgi:hypothetical protein
VLNVTRMQLAQHVSHGQKDERAAATLSFNQASMRSSTTGSLVIRTDGRLVESRDTWRLRQRGFGAFGFGSCGCSTSLRMAFVAVHVGCGFHSEESEAELRKVQQSRQPLLPLPGVALQAACLFAHTMFMNQPTQLQLDTDQRLCLKVHSMTTSMTSTMTSALHGHAATGLSRLCRTGNSLRLSLTGVRCSLRRGACGSGRGR